MRIQAAPSQATEAEVVDTAGTAMIVAPEVELDIDLDPDDAVVPAMAGREFSRFAEEVSIHVSVAMAYVGLEDTHDAVVMSCDLEDADEVAQDGVERVVHFRDEEECDLPVYVSVGIDGVLFVGVQRDDDSVSIVSRPHSLDDVDALLRDIVAAIHREMPARAIH